MTLQLTDGQKDAVDMVGRLLADDENAVGVLTGFAGTGKTTLLKILSETYGEPLIVTPTGKAAIRVAEATGGLSASTIHRWLYKTTENPKTGEPVFSKTPAHELRSPASRLVVVDEASMLDIGLYRDISATCQDLGIKLLVVGDRFQLPPVRNPNDMEFSALENVKTPHRVDLTEVVRQALDSPIIRASMELRKGEMEATLALLDLPAVDPKDLIQTFVNMNPDRALLVWRNETRHRINASIREALGRPVGRVVTGEPLMVTYNNYTLGCFNGEVVVFQDWIKPPDEEIAVRDAYKNISVMASYGLAKVSNQEVLLSPEDVSGRLDLLSKKTVAFWGRKHAVAEFGYERGKEPPYLNANYGYCLTTHKSQGSEFLDVLVGIEKGMSVQSISGRRWLYTAITRAKERLVISFI